MPSSRRNVDRVTQRLASASYVLTIPRRHQPRWWWLGGVLLLALVGLVLLLRTGTPEARLTQERDSLRLDVANLQQAQRLGELKMQQEAGIREELVKQVDTLTQKLKQTEQELSFFKSHQRNRAAPAPAESASAVPAPAPAVR